MFILSRTLGSQTEWQHLCDHGFHADDPKDRLRVMRMILICSDIGCTIEPFAIFTTWCRHLFHEIVTNVNPALTVGDFYQGQVRFLSTYAGSLFAALEAPGLIGPVAAGGMGAGGVANPDGWSVFHLGFPLPSPAS